MRASVPHLKVVERRPAPAKTDTSPRAVAELLARAARQKHREADLRPNSSVRGPFSLPQSHRGTFSGETGRPQAKKPLSRERAKTAAPRQATRQTPDFRVWRRERWLQLRTAFRESVEAASPVVKNGLARLDLALSPEPVPAPDANGEAEPLDRHFEHALVSELRRGGRVLTIAATIALGWAALVPLSGAVIVGGQLVLHSNVKKVHIRQAALSPKSRSQRQQGQCGETRTARRDGGPHKPAGRRPAARRGPPADGPPQCRTQRGREPRWPNAIAADIDPLERDRLLQSERDFFAARATTRRSEQTLAQSRIDQLEKQIAGLEAQLNRTGSRWASTQTS